MFVREKRCRSGNIGVILVDKSNGKIRENKNFGVAKIDAELDALCLDVKCWIRSYAGQQELDLIAADIKRSAEEETNRVLSNIDSLLINGHQLILNQVYDSIGFNQIPDPILRSLSKKRKTHNSETRTTTITFEAIERYTYSGFMVLTAILLCVYAGNCPRGATKSIEVFNFMLHGLLGANPCHTTIRTWLEKLGLDTLKHKDMSLDEAYAIIMNACISVNNQQMLLALKVPADHTDKPLTHGDEEVVGMAISDSWTSMR